MKDSFVLYGVSVLLTDEFPDYKYYVMCELCGWTERVVSFLTEAMWMYLLNNEPNISFKIVKNLTYFMVNTINLNQLGMHAYNCENWLQFLENCALKCDAEEIFRGMGDSIDPPPGFASSDRKNFRTLFLKNIFYKRL